MGGMCAKKYFFLAGLPRCGNTLFASILNQNPNIQVTANSLLPEIFLALKPLYQSLLFKNFPDYKSLDNIIHNIFDNYYKDWNAKYIIDRSYWGTPCNLEFLKALNFDLKFIILVRPVLEILASFIKIEKPLNVEKRCDELMAADGMVGKAILSYQALKKEDCLIIPYNQLTEKPVDTIKKVYQFLKLPLWEHRFSDLDPFNIQGIYYNDQVLSAPLHFIKVDKIKKISYKVEEYLPVNIIKKYESDYFKSH
jgi:sulfotransferase